MVSGGVDTLMYRNKEKGRREQVHVIAIFGPPGSGKSLQREMLKEEIARRTQKEVKEVVVGRCLREMIEEKGVSTSSSITTAIETAMGDGVLLPVALPITMTTEALLACTEEHVCVLDGVGRRLPEWKIIEEVLMFLFPEARVDAVQISVSQATLFNRLIERKRQDDTGITIIRRLSQYQAETEETIKYLLSKYGDAFHCLDGEGTPQQVHQKILECLYPLDEPKQEA